MPVPRVRAAVAAGLNLVVVVCLLLVVAEPASQMGPGSMVIAVVGAAATAALFASNLADSRRGYTLVRRSARRGAPAGGYLVRPGEERR